MAINPTADGSVHVHSRGGDVYRVHTQRLRLNSQRRMHLWNPLTEAGTGGFLSPCLQEVCSGEHPHHQAEELCQRSCGKVCSYLIQKLRLPRCWSLRQWQEISSFSDWQVQNGLSILKADEVLSLSKSFREWSVPSLEHWGDHSWRTVSGSGLSNKRHGHTGVRLAKGHKND